MVTKIQVPHWSTNSNVNVFDHKVSFQTPTVRCGWMAISTHQKLSFALGIVLFQLYFFQNCPFSKKSFSEMSVSRILLFTMVLSLIFPFESVLFRCALFKLVHVQIFLVHNCPFNVFFIFQMFPFQTCPFSDVPR